MLIELHRVGTIAGILIGLMPIGCGGRSGIQQGDSGAPPVPCTINSDCLDGDLCSTKACVDGFCSTIASKTCDDGNVCTADSCEKSTGSCVFTLRVKDNDGDGFYEPLPGADATAPGSCGNDCNDATAAVHPGAPELCDGLDNNCDGRIDEGANSYSPSSQAVRLTDSSFIDGAVGGLAFNGSNFGIAITGSTGTNFYQGYFAGFGASGSNVVALVNETQTAVPSFAGPLVWTGSLFATASQIEGDSGYDIRFSLLDALGQKMGPDLQLTDNPGFSIQPAILWDGSSFWVAWSDDNNGNVSQIYQRRISADGQSTSDAVALTELAYNAVNPLLLKSPTSYLLLFLNARNLSVSRNSICARVLDNDMIPMGSSFCLSDNNVSDFSADWVKDRFIIAWSTETKQPGDSIWAASIDAQGNTIQPAQTISSEANFARSPSVLSLGDRFALAWSDDYGQYDHYVVRLGIYSSTFSLLSNGVQTVATSQYDCWSPGLAAGGGGMGLVYRERVDGKTGHPYFLGLTCGYTGY